MTRWALLLSVLCLQSLGSEVAESGGYYPPRRSAPPGFEYGRGSEPFPRAPEPFPRAPGSEPFPRIPTPASPTEPYPRAPVSEPRFGSPGFGSPSFGSPGFQRPAYSPVTIPLVDVTKYWKLWGLQQTLCDHVASTLEESNVKELTSQQVTQIGKALDRSHQVYTAYHKNMVPELLAEPDSMAVEARLWLGHGQFDEELRDCWSDLSYVTPPSLGPSLYESVHESLARSLCLPFDGYVACRELLQLPRNSMRRFRDQLRVMREEASMLLRRMGRPTRYAYYRNQYTRSSDGAVWLDEAAAGTRRQTLMWVLAFWVITFQL